MLGAFSALLGLILIVNPLPGVVALPFLLGLAALTGGIVALGGTWSAAAMHVHRLSIFGTAVNSDIV